MMGVYRGILAACPNPAPEVVPMRKPVLLIFANASILIVLFCLMAQSLFIVSRLASAKAVSGQVELRRNGGGAFQPVTLGETVKTGDEIQTGANGRAEFAWADGTRWKLEPNTRLSITRAASNSWRKTEQTQFRLDAGKVFVRVVKTLAPGSSFQIETPSAVAAVRGTVWSIEVAGDQTRVGVYKGFVEVTGAKGAETVRPGKEAVAGGGAVSLESARDNAAFEANPDLLRPALDVDVRPAKGGAILTGQTEAGDALTLGSECVHVLSNGAFVRRVPLQVGHNEWKLSATDKHAATSTACRALEYDGKTATASVCR